MFVNDLIVKKGLMGVVMKWKKKQEKKRENFNVYTVLI